MSSGGGGGGPRHVSSGSGVGGLGTQPDSTDCLCICRSRRCLTFFELWLTTIINGGACRSAISSGSRGRVIGLLNVMQQGSCRICACWPALRPSNWRMSLYRLMPGAPSGRRSAIGTAVCLCRSSLDFGCIAHALVHYHCSQPSPVGELLGLQMMVLGGAGMRVLCDAWHGTLFLLFRFQYVH